jgi:hypothetical protein
MPHVELDPHTADRILAGLVAPDDSPPGWAHVVRLLDAAALGEQLVEDTARRTVANMAAVIERLRCVDEARQGGHVRQSRRRVSLVAVLTASTLTIAVGSAAAATHPGAVRGLANRVLAGVSPGSTKHRNRSAAVLPATSTSRATHRADRPRRGETPRNQHGKAVSAVAHTQGLTGRAKGQAVSTVASGGKSHAGDPPGQAKDKPTSEPQHGAPSGTRGQSAAHAHGAGSQGKSAKK